MHYFRNKLNRAPGTLDELIGFNQRKPEDEQWKLLDPMQAGYHMNGGNGEYNVKFVSPDGHFEAVYNRDGVLLTAENDPENMGTYNYFGPDNPAAHVKYDVNPYIEWGNTKDVPSIGIAKHAKATLNTAKFWANLDAVTKYYVLLKKTNSEVYQRTIDYYEHKSY